MRAEDQAAEAAPQPGVEQFGDLFETSRRAGVDLRAHVTGDLSVLGPGVSLAAYRVVQEALANAARHSPGAPVTVGVVVADDVVHIRVANAPGPDVQESPELIEGHGITGMR